MESTSNSDLHNVRIYHERHMNDGQAHYFALKDGRLEVVAQQGHWLAIHRRKALRLLRLQSTECLVDLGCGEGYLTAALAPYTRQCIGIDFAISALQVLRGQITHGMPEIDPVVAFGEHLPLGTGSVDKLVCNHILEHVIDDDAILREIHRILRPGGLVLLGVPLALSPQVRLLLRLRRLVRPRSKLLQLERTQAGALVPELIGKQSHVRLLKRNGFRALRAEGIGMSLRGPLASWFRRCSFLLGLGTDLGFLFPSVGDGVLVLAKRETMWLEG
jgi:SAM-dependent methyltransferase